MPYSSYDHDKLETAETMRIERRIYFEAKDGDIAPYVSLPPEQLHAMREESAAAEQAIFNDLSSRAAAWEEQAGKTLLLDKAIEYTRTTVVQHTANEWQTTEHNRHIRSNRAKYCPDCAAKIRRRQKAESERNRRLRIKTTT